MKKNEIFLLLLIVFQCELSLSVQLRNGVNNNSNSFSDLLTKAKFITYELKAKKVKSSDLSLVTILSREESKSNSAQVIQNLSKKLTEYSGIVKIGNPPQEFEMVFDTGSANFIITSSKCESAGCSDHRKYNSAMSSSAEGVMSLNQFNEDYVDGQRGEVHIRFGTGSVKCFMTEDSVCIGDSICVNKLLILEAFYQTEIPFSNVKFDGIIGLSFSHLSVNRRSNFIDMLVLQGKITQRVFSFYFNNDDSKSSQVHIGGINMDKFNGNLYFADVISKNYWEIKIDGIWYGETKLDFCKDVLCTAVIDTGTSMIAAPAPIIKTLLAISSVKDDCSNMNSLLNLRFEVHGVFFALDPSFYVLKVSDEIFGRKPTSFLDDEIRCINAYMTLNALSTTVKHTIILGTPFFKKYYTVFDRERNRIGFAVANHA